MGPVSPEGREEASERREIEQFVDELDAAEQRSRGRRGPIGPPTWLGCGTTLLLFIGAVLAVFRPRAGLALMFLAGSLAVYGQARRRRARVAAALENKGGRG